MVNHHNSLKLVFVWILVDVVDSGRCGFVPRSYSSSLVLSLGLEKKIKLIIILVDNLALGYSVEVVASSSFSLDLDLETLQWRIMSMNNHLKGGKPLGEEGLIGVLRGDHGRVRGGY